MSADRSYTSSETPSFSASHQALLNQCLNSEIVESPVKSVSRCPRKLASKVCAVTNWLSSLELQPLFNHSGLVEQALRNNYTCCKRGKPNDVTLPDGTEAISMTLTFFDEFGNRRFNVHAHVSKDGRIASTGGKLDPKFMIDNDNRCYHFDESLSTTK